MFEESDNDILRKYFNYWHKKVKIKRDNQTLNDRRMEQREKLEHLIANLKLNKKKLSPQQQQHERILPPEKYKNRYSAQKTTIEKLTNKLEEKDRLINELKMGILNDEALKSLENNKIEIREIFANCSTKIKINQPIPLEYRNDEFIISVNKAPKILLEMEEKALKRAHNHRIILERKRVIEETRKRMVEIGLEKKRAQDEEEKRKNLEAIKKQREEQLKREQLRQRNKTIFMEKWTKSVDFHNRKLLESCFKKLIKHYKDNKNNYKRSIEHYRRKLQITVLDRLKDNVDDSYRAKYQLADCIYKNKLLSKYLQIFINLRLDAIRNMQVAVDYHDFRLQLNVFLAWHRFVCVQMAREDSKTKIAQKHYKMKLLLNIFYQWRSLPVILQLERAKELKKRRWREKVWEILPDYQPPNQF